MRAMSRESDPACPSPPDGFGVWGSGFVLGFGAYLRLIDFVYHSTLGLARTDSVGRRAEHRVERVRHLQPLQRRVLLNLCRARI